MATSSLLTGLVSWWDLDDLLDSHGSNNLTDASNTGTVPFVDGIPVGGNAGDFELGQKNALSAGDAADLSFTDSSFTLAAWVSLEILNKDGTIFGKHDADGNNRSYYLEFENSGNSFDFVTSVDGSAEVQSRATALTITKKPDWFFIIAEWDAGTNIQQVFVNNTAEAASEGTQTAIFESNAPFALGGRGGTALDVTNFDGLIDSAAVWNRVLTPDEKTRLYNGGNGIQYFDAREISVDTNCIIGGNKIGTSDNGDGTMRFCVARQTGSVESTHKLVLGGRQLTLFDAGSGRNALGLYIIDKNTDINSTNLVSGPSYVYKGSRFSTSEDTVNGRNYLDFEFSDDSSNIDHHTIWNGVPIALTADDNSVVVKIINGNVDEIDSVSVGGLPLTVVRIGDNWYLAGFPRI